MRRLLRGTEAQDWSETTVTPLFGPPPKRSPIHVRRSPARQQLLAEAAAAAAFNGTAAYSPSGPPQSPAAPLPRTFDWRAYLQYNPELATAGIRTRRQASCSKYRLRWALLVYGVRIGDRTMPSASLQHHAIHLVCRRSAITGSMGGGRGGCTAASGC